ncbi:hypothetical protein Tco_1428423 [Tanacetum coccineum]
MINSRSGVSATLQYAVCTAVHQSKIRINMIDGNYLDRFDLIPDSKEINPICRIHLSPYSYTLDFEFQKPRRAPRSSINHNSIEDIV